MINVASPKSTTIVIDNNAVQEPSKAYSRPSGHIMFVIVNLDEQAHLVRIPASEFQPNPPAGMDPGPDNPLEAFGWHSVVVDANDVAIIQHKVKAKGHFPKPPYPPNMTYKYTIYWADADGANEQDLDPNVEINN